jgi:tetratricopeptide (TPR) repeat protein
VGKSRLLYEFRKAVANQDVTLLEGRCLSYSRGTAYHLHIDILKVTFDIREDDGDSEITEKVKRGIRVLGADEDLTLPYLLELLSVKDSGIDKIPLSPEARKHRTIEALKRLALKGSQIRPHILAYEDLHWVDKSSEEVLKDVLDSIPGARILLIFTYRPEFLHTWGGKSYHSQVNLNRLSNRESRVMVGHLLGTERIDGTLEEFILEKTEGIPFFIEEFINSLRHLGIIEKKDNTYRIAKDIETVTIPTTIHDVIMARVDSLPDRAKRVLQTGSVVGREFSHDLINRLVERPEQALLSHLSVLKDSELVYERGIYPQSTYIFKHAFTQEVVYNSLLLKRRKDIHKKIGEAIEQVYPERLEEFYEILAYHYSRSDNSEKACSYLKLSGNKSTQNYSLWEAFHFYREAINILNQLPPTDQNKREHIQVRLLSTVPMHVLNHPEDSLQILRDGEKLSKEIGDKKSLSTFHAKLGVYYAHHGEPLLGVRYIENPFREAEKAQDIELMASVACDLCNSYLFASEFSKMIDVGSKVLPLLEKTQRERDFFGFRYNVYSGLCSYWVFACAMLGHFEEGEALFKKGHRFMLETHSLYGLGFLEVNYGMLLNNRGDGENAIEHWQKSIGHLEEAQGILLFGLAYGGLGYGYYLLGELETAQKFIEKGIRIQSDKGVTIYVCMNYLHLGIVLCESSDLKNAQNCIEEALRLAQEKNEKHWEGISKIWLGRISGKTERALGRRGEEYICQGIRMLNALKVKPWCAQGYLFLGELYADTGSKEKALENLKRAKGMFQEMGTDYWLGETRKIMGRL